MNGRLCEKSTANLRRVIIEDTQFARFRQELTRFTVSRRPSGALRSVC
jgi:hypothetical protein